MELLEFKKWQVVLAALFEEKHDLSTLQINNLSTLQIKTNTTYSHVSKLINEMQKAGLVESIVKGRVRLIGLTERGKMLAQKCRELLELAGNGKDGIGNAAAE